MLMKKVNLYIDLLHKPADNMLARSFSLLLAFVLSALLLVNPNHVAGNTSELDHGYLSLLMLALSAAFVHGLGFKPIFFLWKLLFSAYLAWTVLIGFVMNLF